MTPEEQRLLSMLNEFLESTKYIAIWNSERIEVVEDTTKEIEVKQIKFHF